MRQLTKNHRNLRHLHLSSIWSSYFKRIFVTGQSSILRFIEDNWNLGRIGNQSFDALAGTLDNMFSFQGPENDKLILDDQTGEPVH